MRKERLTAILLHLAPIMVGTLLVLTATFGHRLIRAVPWAFGVAAAASAVISGVSVLWYAGGNLWARLRVSSVPALLSLSGFGLLLLIEARPARAAFAAAVAGLLALFAVHVRRAHALRAIGADAAEVERLCDALRTLTMFFAFAFAFGAQGFLAVPAWVLTAAIGAAGGVAAFASLSRGNGKDAGILAAAAATVAVELQVILSFLPTSSVTDAAVAAVLFWFLLAVFRHSAESVSDDRFVRRHVALASALIVLVLASARWA